MSRDGKKGGRKFGDLAELFKAGNFPRKVANLQFRKKEWQICKFVIFEWQICNFPLNILGDSLYIALFSNHKISDFDCIIF